MPPLPPIGGGGGGGVGGVRGDLVGDGVLFAVVSEDFSLLVSADSVSRDCK